MIVSLIPVIVLGTFCYGQIRDLLISREKTALKETLIQESHSLNYKMTSYISAMNHIIWDKDIRNGLTKEYKSNFDMYLAYQEIYDPLFTTIRSLHSDIDTVTIYTDNPMHPHGSVLRPLNDVSDTAWFKDALSKTSPFFVTSHKDNTLYLVCQIYLSYSDYTTILCIDINYNKTFKSLSSLFEQSYGIVLTDATNQTIYSHHKFKKEEDLHYILTPDQLIHWNDDKNIKKKYVIESISSPENTWNIYLYRPTKTVSASANQITIIVLIIIFCCLISVVTLSTVFSKLIVRPLELLVQNMDQIENGNISVSIAYHSTDEIGHLIQRFVHMVHRLQHLIDEVLKSKIKQQEYEMKALQAQINPHFLYNSLSLINGKAIMAEQGEISQMAQLLSTFYRTTLNKGKNTLTVQNELENIRSYISIQLIMHSNSFLVTYDIDPKVLKYTMINLLLQPLVENAIMHGIDHKETPGCGELIISCRSKEEILIFEISDNGPGIPESKLESILTTSSFGYGIQNVHHRIQLFYGEQYGLEYRSNLNTGTTVSVSIPLDVKHL